MMKFEPTTVKGCLDLSMKCSDEGNEKKGQGQKNFFFHFFEKKKFEKN